MHSIIFSTVVITVLVAYWLGLTNAIPVPAIAVALAVFVAAIGLPHGALDHRSGQRMFGQGVAGQLVFFATYLAIMAAVVIGWYFVPAITLVTFFVLSAWHFGLEEDDRPSRRWHQFVAMVARGGMVIWIPAVVQPEIIAELLAVIVPGGDSRTVVPVIALMQWLAPLLALLVVFDCLTYSTTAGSSAQNRGSTRPRPDALHVLRVGSLALLFAFVHPLVSFGIYFCGWHSIRGLAHLREEHGDLKGSFAMALIPMTVAAVAMAMAGWLVWQFSIGFTPALIRTTFIGLSAVAIPHLLLHVLGERQFQFPTQSAGVMA